MELASAMGTFATYLAKYYVAKKGFVFGTVPEARALEAACDIVLTFSDNVNFRIICIVDREANPVRQFEMSHNTISQIAEQCRKYTGRVGYSKTPVVIDIFEIGSNSGQDRLKQFAESSSSSKVVISGWIVSTLPRSVWTNARFNGFFRGRLLIQHLMRGPRPADTDLEPIIALAQPPCFPFGTYTLLSFLVAVFIGECIVGLGPSSTLWAPTVRTLLALGGLSWDATVGHHEWYRLLSATFLHVDVTHLLLNCVALFFAARPVECLLGRAWFLAIYTITALGGSVMSLTLNPPNLVSVGASEIGRASCR